MTWPPPEPAAGTEPGWLSPPDDELPELADELPGFCVVPELPEFCVVPELPEELCALPEDGLAGA